jgi:hypothetical protein
MLNFDLPEFDPDRSAVPLTLMWLRPDNPGPVYLTFSNLAAWQQFIAEFALNPLVPQVMWDSTTGRRGSITSVGSTATASTGELAALVALELALIYLGHMRYA